MIGDWPGSGRISMSCQCRRNFTGKVEAGNTRSSYRHPTHSMGTENALELPSEANRLAGIEIAVIVPATPKVGS